MSGLKIVPKEVVLDYKDYEILQERAKSRNSVELVELFKHLLNNKVSLVSIDSTQEQYRLMIKKDDTLSPIKSSVEVIYFKK